MRKSRKINFTAGQFKTNMIFKTNAYSKRFNGSTSSTSSTFMCMISGAIQNLSLFKKKRSAVKV